MTGIFYFSSTGNSLYIAQVIKKELGGRIIYIPYYKGNAEEYDRIIIVSPIYSYGLPVHTYDLLKNLTPKSKAYIVLNYGGMVGGADLLTYNIAKEHNVNIRAIYTIKMPENFTLTFSTPKFYNDIVLKSAPKKIEKIVTAIKSDAINVPKNKKTKEKTYYKNKSNWHLIAKDFSINDNCIKCGKCVQICPVHNIISDNGKIKFNDNCIACLGCYHRCPQKAIVYKNKKKQDRYINPNINEKNIGKDLYN